MKKRILIDLGGCYPAKSKYVQFHAFNLGWSWNPGKRESKYHEERRLFLGGNCHLSRNIGIFDEVEQVITAERFLEMTKEDVLAILRPEPKLVEVTRYRHVIKTITNTYLDTALYKSRLLSGEIGNVIGYKEVKVWIREDEV